MTVTPEQASILNEHYDKLEMTKRLIKDLSYMRDTGTLDLREIKFYHSTGAHKSLQIALSDIKEVLDVCLSRSNLDIIVQVIISEARTQERKLEKLIKENGGIVE